MAQNIELGRKGEDLAEKFLMDKGYSILHRNWRTSHYEIDIIAMKDQIIHFVEVKLRSSGRFGLPEIKVTRKKFNDLSLAANAFLSRNLQFKHIRFDILSITTALNKDPEYFFIEDVYL